MDAEFLNLKSMFSGSVFTGSNDNSIRLYDSNSAVLKTTFTGHTNSISGVRVSSDTLMIVYWSKQNILASRLFLANCSRRRLMVVSLFGTFPVFKRISKKLMKLQPIKVKSDDSIRELLAPDRIKH